MPWDTSCAETVDSNRPMGRPSVKRQRTEEILDAFALCIARYGLEGSTLERIATEAGVQRAILRHHIGNRDELIAALGEHIEREFPGATEAYFARLPESNRLEHLVNILFDPSMRSKSQELAVAMALTSISDRFPGVAAGLRSWLLKLDHLVAMELSRRYPQATPTVIAAVSFGLLSIYFQADTLASLQRRDRFSRTTKQTAWRLIHTLDSDE